MLPRILERGEKLKKSGGLRSGKVTPDLVIGDRNSRISRNLTGRGEDGVYKLELKENGVAAFNHGTV